MTHTILLTILLAKSCGRRFPSIEYTTQAHFLGGTLSNHTTAENYLFTLEPYAQGRPLNLLCASLMRSEEHTSELQSRGHLVCRLLLEKKNHDAGRPRARLRR